MAPRLKSLPPRLAPMPSRLGTVAPANRKEAETQRTRQRDQDDPSRKLYNSRKWRALRDEVYIRDNMTCQKTGVILLGKHPAPNSPVADHIVPHRGDPALFWDKSNIQTVSKAYHDSQKQREERARW
ncbi:HNH endonuclease [Agrobacterium sp. Ap1]|uniref:HNH endonuclease n=1 Tax=Agrobacterium sp. Ap1 TaxID=2815337 RepID=UPI001A8E855A|nr:HNH endonuclease [Agrobacterium sp. Ap1]MBO0140213.1 HNH endonuclease [Agrobacterium sp. Ap1]